MAGEVEAGLGAADGVQALGGGRGLGLTMLRRFEVQCEGIWRPPDGGIVCGADGLQQLLFDGVAEGEADGAIAVVGEEPVVARLEGHAGGDEKGFVAGAGDLKEDFLLALEDDLAIVGLAGQVHEAVEVDQLLTGEHVMGASRVEHTGSVFRSYGLCHPILTDSLIVLR